MPKRPADSQEERWKYKLMKYQQKLKNKQRANIVSVDEESVTKDQEDNQNDLDTVDPIENEISPTNATLESGISPDMADMTTEIPSGTITSTAAPETPDATPSPPSLTVAPVIDPELLQALGDNYTEEPEWGENLLDDISQRWEPILKMGLSKESKEELNKKYLIPKNIPSCKAPVLNPEISSVLTESSRNRDKRLVSKQHQLGRALGALGKAVSGLLTKTMETTEVLRTLNDAGKLIADSHFAETDTRRSLITPLLDKTFVEPFKDRRRDSYLFGEKLGEFIKSSRGVKKTGQLITPSSSNTLNSRSPAASSSLPRQMSSTPRAQYHRGAGSRAQYNARRRAPVPPPPPPPPPRRQAPRAQAAPYRAPTAPSTSRNRNLTK